LDSFDTPVLLIAFNRPELFAELIDSLRVIAPTKIFVAIDGPREDNSDDDLKVCQTVELIDRIDWNCELSVLNRDSNLGCGLAVSSAISWVLETEQSVIILEDDIRPNTTFFSFCAQALRAYQDDERVMTISGHSTIEINDSPNVFRTSKYPVIWGWATWQRSWNLYQYSLDGLPKISLFYLTKVYRGNLFLAMQSWMNFRAIRNGAIDTWDYQLFYISILFQKLHIIANYNLTENVGFNSQATHTIFLPEPSPTPREMKHIAFTDELEVSEIYERKTRSWLQNQLFRSARTYIRMRIASTSNTIFRNR
jgi:hypothetical protein